MFITVLSVIFLMKLRWPKNERLYIQLVDDKIVFVQFDVQRKSSFLVVVSLTDNTSNIY